MVKNKTRQKPVNAWVSLCLVTKRLANWGELLSGRPLVRIQFGVPARRKRLIACGELFHFITKLIARSLRLLLAFRPQPLCRIAVRRPPHSYSQKAQSPPVKRALCFFIALAQRRRSAEGHPAQRRTAFPRQLFSLQRSKSGQFELCIPSALPPEAQRRCAGEAPCAG